MIPLSRLHRNFISGTVIISLLVKIQKLGRYRIQPLKIWWMLVFFPLLSYKNYYCLSLGTMLMFQWISINFKVQLFLNNFYKSPLHKSVMEDNIMCKYYQITLSFPPSTVLSIRAVAGQNSRLLANLWPATFASPYC